MRKGSRYVVQSKIEGFNWKAVGSRPLTPEHFEELSEIVQDMAKDGFHVRLVSMIGTVQAVLIEKGGPA